MKRFGIILAFCALLSLGSAQAQLAGGLIFPGPGTPAASGGGGFTNTRSLIFTSASSQYISATGKTGINQQKFTISFWIKRASVGTLQGLWSAGDGTAANYVELFFTAGNTLRFTANTASATVVSLVTTATFTDTTSWHHVLVAVDTTQATANNRVKMWFDGTQIVAFSTQTNPTLNSNLSNNFAATYVIGALNTTTVVANFWNGKIDEFYYIDGQQLAPTSFITGTPGTAMAYTGTYTGTFDYYLNFENATSTTTLGVDNSGESNNWTLNAMTTANSSTDVP